MNEIGPKSDGRMRVGAVSYLNTKPLVYQFEQFAPDAELVFDLPSRLADALARGDLDVALIPSVEYMQDSSYFIVSDACIACRGPVLSVKLLSRTPLQNIRTLALDEGSRTSVALVRILLKEKAGVSPELRPFPIGSSLSELDTDAVLVIGDRAIHPPAEQFELIWDLGDQWCRWSELPFVFAMWTARKGVDARGLDEALARARDAGLSNLREIAAQEAPAVNLPEEDCLSYLRDNLYFRLGQREQSGLRLFYQHAARLGLAPDDWDLNRIGEVLH